MVESAILDQVDFDLAEEFLRVARAAYESDSQPNFIAARKMVALALCIREAPSEELNAVRLKRGR